MWSLPLGHVKNLPAVFKLQSSDVLPAKTRMRCIAIIKSGGEALESGEKALMTFSRSAKERNDLIPV